jgi:hypothetical protein
MDHRWVSWHVANEMAKYDILFPPKATVPKGFGLSLGGVPMPPVPKSVDFDIMVYDITNKEKLWLGQLDGLHRTTG